MEHYYINEVKICVEFLLSFSVMVDLQT